MRIGVPRETTSGERRVALVPESVGRLVKAGIAVVVEHGAGDAAGFTDAAYAAAGATPGPATAAFGGVDLVLKVQAPDAAEAALVARGAIVVAFLAPHTHGAAIATLQAHGVTGLAVELVPR